MENIKREDYMNMLNESMFNEASRQQINDFQVKYETAEKELEIERQQWDANKLQNAYGELLHSANGLSELLKNLLGWAQIQTGRVMYNPVLFNLVAALEPDINLIKKMAESKDISFEAKIPETAFLTADENMMITVIRNLLANAVKFTSAGGTVTFEITPQTSHLKPHTAFLFPIPAPVCRQ